MDWFLYDNSLRLQRVNHNGSNVFQRKQKSVKFRKNPTQCIEVTATGLEPRTTLKRVRDMTRTYSQCIEVEEKLYLDYYHWYTLLNSDSFPASI